MKTVIMAGGCGTRIAELFPDIPKPIIPIKNRDGIEKPVLEWELLSLVVQGFTEILLTVGYMADKIQSYLIVDSLLTAVEMILCKRLRRG